MYSTLFYTQIITLTFTLLLYHSFRKDRLFLFAFGSRSRNNNQPPNQQLTILYCIIQPQDFSLFGVHPTCSVSMINSGPGVPFNPSELMQ
jgi:hypothetical protein